MATIQPQLGLGLGAVTNQVVNLYTGEDFRCAQAAVQAAGEQGQISIGSVVRNPTPSLTLRFGGPGAPMPEPPAVLAPPAPTLTSRRSPNGAKNDSFPAYENAIA